MSDFFFFFNEPNKKQKERQVSNMTISYAIPRPPAVAYAG